MPWEVAHGHGCPASRPWAVIKSADHRLVACHVTKQDAQKQVAALYANESKGDGSMSEVSLAEARQRSRQLRAVLRYVNNVPVVDDRQRRRRAELARRLNDLSLGLERQGAGEIELLEPRQASALDGLLKAARAAFERDDREAGLEVLTAQTRFLDEMLKPRDEEKHEDPEHLAERAVDNSAWDGGAAMSSCASKSAPGGCYSAICAGRKAGDPSLQSSWALPHHKSAGSPPNADGVRNSLSRLPQTQGLTNRAAAQAHLDAHMAAIQAAAGGTKSAAPPREGYRSMAVEIHREEDQNGLSAQPVMRGNFAVFDEWTEINDLWEGHFLESIAPGAFERTFAEDRDHIRVLFQHGRDAMMGSKPIGVIDKLEETKAGASYRVPLFRGIPELILEGLDKKQYGASFRFEAVREQLVEKPKVSSYNPRGLPERTLLEVRVAEFGPVTFPAYTSATAGLRSRSLTSRFMASDDQPAGRSSAGSADGGEEIDVSAATRRDLTSLEMTFLNKPLPEVIRE